MDEIVWYFFLWLKEDRIKKRSERENVSHPK